MRSLSGLAPREAVTDARPAGPRPGGLRLSGSRCRSALSVVRRPVGPAATTLTRAQSALCARRAPCAGAAAPWGRRAAARARPRRRQARARPIASTAPRAPAGGQRGADEDLAPALAAHGQARARAGRALPRAARGSRAARAPRPAAAARRPARQAARAGGRRRRSKRSTRLLLVSATYTSPLQSTAIARRLGEFARPDAAQAPLREEVAVGCRTPATRLFSLSSTYTRPAPSTATPAGERKRPSAAAARAPFAEHGSRRGRA